MERFWLLGELLVLIKKTSNGINDEFSIKDPYILGGFKMYIKKEVNGDIRYVSSKNLFLSQNKDEQLEVMDAQVFKQMTEHFDFNMGEEMEESISEDADIILCWR
ncbi:MAG: hypothetical protein ABIG10_01390 [bacterium]